jgi:uncharacterized protein (DUF1778 family)
MAIAARERIDMRVDEETKQLAERAAAALGTSTTEFITRLIRENAPAILERQATIRLTNAQFDRFMTICQDETRKPSARIVAAAKRLDEEGF